MAPKGSASVKSAPLESSFKINDKCFKCNKIVKNGILCDVCDRWYHFKCGNLPNYEEIDVNEDWHCAACDRHDSGNEGLNTVSCEYSSALEIIKVLQNDIEALKNENSLLKSKVQTLESSANNVSLDLPNLCKPSTDNLKASASQPTLYAQRRWESVRPKQGKSPRAALKVNNSFPPLKNSFEPLLLLNESNENRPTLPVLEKHRPKREIARTINIYADSQGRNLALDLKERSGHTVHGLVKPNATFQEATHGCSNGKADFTIFLAGTNDVGRNERKNLIRALRKRLDSLRCSSNVVVCSVPHRHDLPSWSCVNIEVEKTNEDMARTCKYFQNVRFLDISRLGRRFHTQQGLHLNNIGKMYVASRILDIIYETNMTSTCKVKPIPLDFLE